MNPAKTKSLYQLLTFGSLCNNANIIQKKKAYVLDGDPTESACSCGNESWITREALKGKFEIIREFPFDSTRKMMSVIVRDREGKSLLLRKEHRMFFCN